MAILRHSKGVGKNAGDCDEVNFTLYLLLLFILIIFIHFVLKSVPLCINVFFSHAQVHAGLEVMIFLIKKKLFNR